MFHRLNAQAAALAAVVTLGTLSGLNVLADQRYEGAARDWQLSQAEAAWPSTHQVVVTGTQVRQVVVTGHRRG